MTTKGCPVASDELLQATLQIVQKHLDRTAVETEKLPGLIADVRGALVGNVMDPPDQAQPVAPSPKPRSRKSAMPLAAAPASEQSLQWPNRLGPAVPGKRQNEPAVPIEQSVLPDAIVCLEDGMRRKMLKQWLATRYGLTPDEYRARWGLPADYPMSAAVLRETKRAIAKRQGFGRPRRPTA